MLLSTVLSALCTAHDSATALLTLLREHLLPIEPPLLSLLTVSLAGHQSATAGFADSAACCS